MNMKRLMVKEENGILGHMIYEPVNMTKDMPLLIYLHGAGERGTNLEHVERHGVPYLIANENAEIPALVLCPQCPAQFVWNNVAADVKKLIDKIILDYGIKRDRICITGSSMGGYGTWEMGITYPDFFSAIAPVCGGGMQWRSQKLVNTPVKAYHGDKDDVVELINSELMIKNIKSEGGRVELCVLNGFGHNDGIYEAYKNRDLIEWMLQQRRTNFEPVKEICWDLF